MLISRPIRHRPRIVIRVLAALVAAVALSTAALPTVAAGPSITLEGPRRAEADRPFVLRLVARGVRGVGGFEADLRFDPAVVRFGGARLRHPGGLSREGRDVLELGPVFTERGVTVGAVACEGANCLRRAGRPRAAAGGKVVLARLTFSSDRSGPHGIRLLAASVVDATGSPILGGWGGPGRPQGRSLDVSGDGRVDFADVARAAVAWQRARLAGTGSCSVAAAVRDADIDGDGCLAVGDVARIAADPTGPSAGAGPGTGGPSTPTVAPAAVPGGGPIVVDTTGDGVDATPGDGICGTAAGFCSLRAAITEANLATGPDTIAFAIPGPGTHTIVIGSPLPALSDLSGGTTIDGYTQPGSSPNTDALGSNAAIRIEITGSTSIDGLVITSPDNVVRGLSLWDLRQAIWLTGPGAHHNVIVGSFIGLDADAGHTPPLYVDGAYGVSMTAGAHHNTVGRPTLEDRNVISSNAHSGVWLWGEAVDHNVIQNAIAGLSPDGSERRRNKGRGIDLNAMASYNIVGGTGPYERNVTSGNDSEGIEISHNPLTVANRVVGNFVGTRLDGESAATYTRNQWAGIHLEDGVSSNVVSHNVVGNSGCLNNAGGIVVENFAPSNVISHNLVGITPGGANIASCFRGLSIRTGASRSRVTDNVVANQETGIWVSGSNVDETTIRRNLFTAHTIAAIDLASPDGPGVSASSGNDGRAAPSISTASPELVVGSTCALCDVELFRADGATLTAGTTALLGTTTANGSGAFGFAFEAPGLAEGTLLTATTTDTGGATSELSLPVLVTADPGGGGVPETYADDTFTRTVGAGWGTADLGGSWTALSSAANFSVDGSVGRIRVPNPGNTRSIMLQGVVQQDVDITLRFRADKVPAGGHQFFYVIGRRGPNEEYRAKVRLEASGTMVLRAARLAGSTETNLAPDSPRYPTPGGWIRLRVQLLGASPTTIRIKAWADGDPEPDAWQYSVTDGTADLQDAGHLGLRAYIGSATTNAPVTFDVDDLRATSPQASGGATLPPPPPPDPPVSAIAVDRWERAGSDTWGDADVGGGWSLYNPQADYDIHAGRGGMLLPRAGANRGAILPTPWVADLDLLLTVRTDKLPVGGSLYGYAVLRHTMGGVEYRAKVRIAPNGAVYLHASRVAGNVETSLGGEARVIGLTYTAGMDLRLRARVTGTHPTAIQLRAWAAGTTEPTAWRLELSDAFAPLQGPGNIGLRAYLGSGTSNAPLIMLFDDLEVTSP